MSFTPEQLAIRAQGPGGSEVAALVGMSPYAGPIDVYARLVEGHTLEDNHHMERGRFYEAPTAEWYAFRHNASLRQVGTIQHPTKKHVLCTPDFLATPDGGEEIDLSIKVPGPRTWHQWGTPGTDEVPRHYLVQVQYELILLKQLHGVSRAVIAAPVDGDLCEYPVAADPDMQEMLLEAVERFMADHVNPRRPPPPDASPGYADFLRKKFPAEARPFIPADAHACRLASDLRIAEEAIDAATERKEAARQALIALIGDASGIDGPNFRISYKQTKGKPSTNWDAVCAAAGVPRTLIEQHTKRSPYRVFRPTFTDTRKK